MKKKLLYLVIVTMLVIILVPEIAAADKQPGLIITEVLRNPLGNDTYENIELMNASDTKIDLYDYMIYYYCNSSATTGSINALASSEVKQYCYLAAEPGKDYLEPGNMAFVWCVFSDVYTKEAPGGEKFVIDNKDGTVTYNFDALRSYLEFDSAKTLDPSVKVIVNDKSDGHYYATQTNTEWGFSLVNTGLMRLWVCRRGETIDTALSFVDVPVPTAGLATSYDIQNGLSPMTATDSTKFTPGMLDDAQTNLIKLMNELNIKISVETSTTPQTTEAPITTKAPEVVTTVAPTETSTTPSDATEASPNTSAVSPSTSKAPDTDIPKTDKGGCGSLCGGAAIMMLMSVVGTGICIRKKK